MALTTDQFDYPLPQELIAQQPLAERAASRLMVLQRSSGRTTHRVFADLPEVLRTGDLLVVNDTQVLPAKFSCRRGTGGRIDGLFLAEQPDGTWLALLKGAARCRPGEMLTAVGAEDVTFELIADEGQGQWRLRASEPSTVAVLQRIGRTPLPPYIHRPDGSADEDDRRRYQTVYARRPGAVAAPTAGLHFTEAILAALDQRGIGRVALTLHVGLGTFQPVKADRVDQHPMHAEWYELPAETADRLNAARQEGRRIVAIGTTSVRVLETVAGDAPAQAPFRAASGWTDIFLYPPAMFRATEALITNFHLPRSTLLMLVAAFCSPGNAKGIATILHAYAEAVRAEYRFYSYGDAMLIE